jgi:anti-sigma B factor antagonist
MLASHLLAGTRDPRRPKGVADRHRRLAGRRSPARCGATLTLAFALAAVSALGAFQLKSSGASLGSAASLIRFFGLFNAVAGALALILQLFVPRILARLGPCGSLLVTPVTLLGTVVALAACPGLAAAAVQKGVEHALRSSIDRTALDLRYQPLASHVAWRMRTMAEAILPRAAEATAAALALMSISVLHEPPSRLTVPGVLLLAVAITAGIFVRREYAAGALEAAPQSHGAGAMYGFLRSDVDPCRARMTREFKGAIDMNINCRHVEGATVLDIRGAIQAKGIETVVAAVRAAFDDGQPLVVINLEQVRSVDLAGLGGLLETHAMARARGWTLRLASVTTGIQDLLVITRLLTVFDTFETVEQAIAGRPAVEELTAAHAVSSAGIGTIPHRRRHV